MFVRFLFASFRARAELRYYGTLPIVKAADGSLPDGPIESKAIDYKHETRDKHQTELDPPPPESAASGQKVLRYCMGNLGRVFEVSASMDILVNVLRSHERCSYCATGINDRECKKSP